MEVLYSRCAGLDVHKDTVVACVRVASEGKVSREMRTFDTTTAGLVALSSWLAESGCTHIAMEATGVYWKPVWHILAADGFALILGNAAHVKNVPGRKTDIADAAWLADLLAHGLIRASFVPEPALQEIRTLLRTRKQLGREKTAHVQRLQKTLEDANIKLDSVITDVIGVSGRAMIEALIAGESDPAALARLAHRRLKASPGKLSEARAGDPASSLPVAPPSATGRCRGHGDRSDRPGGRSQSGSLSRRRTKPDRDSRRRRAGQPDHRLRDRHRHEPLPDRRAPPLVGRSVPPQ